MKIYDCFTFYNELDLLELRLRETYDHVDVFVIAEADMSFTGKAKPFHLLENWERFAPWHDKIRRIPIMDLDANGDPWNNEAYSRECLMQGLYDADPLDIIMVSDCDEIMRTSTFKAMRDMNRATYGFRMPLLYFRLNYMQTSPTLWWAGGSATRRVLLNSMEELRRARHHIGSDGNGAIITHAGWHFGWLGDEDRAKEKIKSFAHTELDKPELTENLNLELSISKGRGLNPNAPADREVFQVVAVNDYFPDTVLVDKERWIKYIIPNATVDARVYLGGTAKG